MHPYLRQALPGMLVGSGLTLAVIGLPAGEQTLPGALLMVIGGAGAQLYQHLNRPRPAVRRVVVVPAARRAVGVPTQRRTPGVAAPPRHAEAVVPSPPSAHAEQPALGVALPGHAARPLGGLPAWRDVARPGSAQRGGLRHCVRPHGALPPGELPHQRRESEGS